MQNGKGSAQRPAQVPQEVVTENWNTINWKKKNKDNVKKIQKEIK